MIFDKENLFSDAQAVTVSAASTNVIDFGISRNIGVGENLYIGVYADSAMVGVGASLDIVIEVSTDEAFSSPIELQKAESFAVTSPAGSKVLMRIDPSEAAYQYMRIGYVVVSGPLTGGTFTAGIVHDIAKTEHYASGFSIS